MAEALREPYLTPNGSNDDNASFENIDYRESYDYTLQSPSTVDSTWGSSLLKSNDEFSQLGLGLSVEGHLENGRASHSDPSSNEAYFQYMEEKPFDSYFPTMAQDIPFDARQTTEWTDSEGSRNYIVTPDMPQGLENPLPMAVDHCMCKYTGCKGQTFTRTYDLKRHIKEQHECPHQACGDRLFEQRNDLKTHLKEEHPENPHPFECGSCKLTQKQPKCFPRNEKLKNHLERFHKMDQALPFNSLQCLVEPCFKAGVLGGIYFASEADFSKHQAAVHSTSPASYCGGQSELVSPSTPSLQANPNNCVRSQLPSDGLEKQGPGNKRTINKEFESGAKRGKYKYEAAAGSRTHKQMLQPVGHRIEELHSPRSIKGGGHQYEQRLCEPNNHSLHPDGMHIPNLAYPSSEEIPSVRIIDMHALVKHHEYGSILEQLKSLHVSSCFQISKETIKLQGSSSAAKQGKNMLEEALRDVRRYEISEPRPSNSPRDGTWKKCSVNIRKASTVPGPSSLRGKIFAIRANEDSEVLTTWVECILPRLPEFLTPLLGKDYSAALVRQQVYESEPVPTIRIQSALGQSEDIRKIIRTKVERICQENRQGTIPVHFSEGSKTLLVGGNSANIGCANHTVLDDDLPNDRKRFPHHRRYWSTPGMGASIGLSRCNTVSATLGGYILIDSVKHMLTVDHFIRNVEEGISDWRITSPSLLDIGELRSQLQQKLRELAVKAGTSCQADEILLDELQRSMFPNEINEELEYYQQFQKDLFRNTEEYVLGDITQRCRSDWMRPATSSYFSPSNGSQVKHRMDWSISKVSTRAGKNVHRHRPCAELGIEDFKAEGRRPEGVGIPCEEAGEVMPNDLVHYVGQTSGQQRGEINPAPIMVSDEYGESHECAMILQTDIQQSAEDYLGDSGAWIIRDCDNKLVGLLWGWDNGQHLFTPIQDVFADIMQSCCATEIRLPLHRKAPSSGIQSPTRICRDINRKPERTLDELLPPASSAQPALVAPVERLLGAPIIDSDNVSTKKQSDLSAATALALIRPPSPAPSLDSSVSTAPDALSPCSSLDMKSQSNCDLIHRAAELTLNEDAEDKPGIFEESEEYPSKVYPSIQPIADGLEKKHSLEHILESLQHKSVATWLSNNKLRGNQVLVVS